MYDIYKEEYLNSVTEKEFGEGILNKLGEYDKFILDWDINDLENFIRNSESISTNVISKNLSYLRKINEIISNKYNTNIKQLKLPKDKKNYIDFNALISVTLTEDHFKELRRSLVKIGKTSNNYRDAVILILSWEGLMANEVKKLKKTDIDFIKEFGEIKAKIWIINNNKKIRKIIIRDVESIIILKKAIEEIEYYIPETKNKDEYFLKLRNMNTVIRPAGTRGSDKETVANPSQLLKVALKKVGKIPGAEDKDLKRLKIADIRRSRILDLFYKDVDISYVENIFHKSNRCDLYDLQEMAVLMKRYIQQKK